jgi:C-terminal processing protease CtpA/Prc
MPAMKGFLALAVLMMASIALSQQIPFAITGIRIGGGSSDTCPVLVTGIYAGSPAELAGVRSGDVLVAVGGVRVPTFDEAVKLLHTEAETPVSLQMMRGERPYTATVGREKLSTLLEKSGNKILESGMIVPLDATETEMKNKMKALLARERLVDRVFPTHYPKNEKIYYAGFEVLILKNPSQVVVLGIEDGPASRAGVHWGDTILSVNGVDPRNEAVAELEKLFSSEKPATMTLKIERGGMIKTYVFELAQATQVLRDNWAQLVHGRPLPVGIPEKYLHCFFD